MEDPPGESFPLGIAEPVIRVCLRIIFDGLSCYEDREGCETM
jgi:hypothetical protein